MQDKNMRNSKGIKCVHSIEEKKNEIKKLRYAASFATFDLENSNNDNQN